MPSCQKTRTSRLGKRKIKVQGAGRQHFGHHEAIEFEIKIQNEDLKKNPSFKQNLVQLAQWHIRGHSVS